MELSRNEIVNIYNKIKNVDVKGMSPECRKAFIINSIKLQPFADKINSENTKVADSLRTDTYITALKKYMSAKAALDKEKNEKTIKAFEEAANKFDPLYKDMEEKFSEITAKLDQFFSIDVELIPMIDYLDFLEKQEKSITYTSISDLSKLFIW